MAYDKTRQFRLTPWEFLEKLDLLNWMRYAAIIRALTNIKPRTVLEVGPGEGVIKNVMKDFVERYDTMDVNPKLSPTYGSDIREFVKEAAGRYDAVIAADILEHIPFGELETALKNLNAYLAPSGAALITIPHRAWFIFEMNWFYLRECVLRAPDWLRSLFHRLRGRKNPIDPDHEWEIGDGEHTIGNVEEIMKKAGFNIVSRHKLAYVDFWVLRK